MTDVIETGTDIPWEKDMKAAMALIREAEAKINETVDTIRQSPDKWKDPDKFDLLFVAELAQCRMEDLMKVMQDFTD